jgi:hypothetical protein
MADGLSLQGPSLNPFSCSGTALPPNLLLGAKILALSLFLKGYVFRMPGIFLPMWPALDHLPSPELIRYGMQIIMLAAIILLLCNRKVRTCSLIIGFLLLFAMVASRGFYSNGRLFCASFFILIGLYESPLGIWPVRWQFVILYLGAGLNKLLLSDWQTGWYFEHWMKGILEQPLYITTSTLFPPMILSFLFSWITILIELSIGIFFAVPRWYRLGIWVAIFFHFSAVALSGRMYGIFVIAMTFSLLAFIDLPGPGELKMIRMPQWLQRILNRFDFDHSIDWSHTENSSSSLILSRQNHTHSDFAAMKFVLLALPVFYYIAAVVLIIPSWILD